MIERIHSPEQLELLPQSGTEAQKIRALFNAYGCGYDFCRFFRHGGTYLAALDGSFVIAEQPGADAEEIAEFLRMHGFTDMFCSEKMGELLRPLLPAEFTQVQLMVYDGAKQVELPQECSPSEAWSIIGSRFDIPFEPWYLDMSHRVRHGVARCFSDGRAALVVQHDINGEALISQVSVLREFERQGIAGALVRQVSAALPGEVQIVCEERLCGFYEKCGYFRKSKKYVAAVR